MRPRLRERVFREWPTEDELAEAEVENALDYTPDERLAFGLSMVESLAALAGSSRSGGRRRVTASTAQEDHAELLRMFNEHGVRYVVVGGIAVLRLVPYRNTFDLDVLVEPTVANTARVRDAITEFFETPPSTSPEEMLGVKAIRYGGRAGVDVHTMADGVSWGEVWSNREMADFRGIPAPFSDLDRLILMKEAAGRSKDRRDLTRLRRLKDRRPTTRRPRRTQSP